MTASQPIVAAVAVLLFVLVHVFGGRLTFLSGTPRSVWLSIAGGVSVAYVFVHLLPELAEHQESFRARSEEAEGLFRAIELHAYLLALLGLVIFYGLERFACRAGSNGAKGTTPLPVFWTHLGAFAVYNLLIGYLLLHREEADLRGLVIFAAAMAFHFVVNDQGLREHHGRAYDRLGRWLLAAAPVAGWALALSTTIPPLAINALFALLAGGIILNVLKEELPEKRKSRFSAFAIGAAAYGSLLLGTA